MKTVKYYVAALGLSAAVAAGFMSCMKGGKMESITVTPSQAIISEGDAKKFTATARFSDGTAIDWTTSADWISANPDLVSVSTTSGSQGLATAASITTGPVTITAKDTANNISADATIFITKTPLLSLQITPISETIFVGATKQFAANGTYRDGSTSADLVNFPPLTQFVTWNSSNPEVATISNTEGSTGVATGVAPGMTTITATDPKTQVFESTVLFVQ